ncbi:MULTISPECIES: phosphate ABC transporter ATP-binding protein [Olivibacter]|jgi:phosphate transport system ATP-binding protein|uniref:Phosphate-transporting ATPase n=3 Tax=Sphingobacteriaceae TaxID=84566 RepID=F4C684_SPHS2|nr:MULTISPECIES: phosphate ABC transporter ATP-binding protein [Olivibacter]MCL4641553.1 phosphate ABC transporter ATP-binding protein [Olivibacter sp. UJ_SKK_5.1]MDM8173339.1 phosphate ABC transporter ATP-binding protein [Olivibacter sp. 47]MDX3915224.1 phosphate ABC transporter ATP-binding protein [Pseudosphingobacterium sp.]QEL03114.1 phosphate ABC transporter ATP-binding protein [Olivibacter sp. LS-1]
MTQTPHISVKDLNVHISGNHLLKNININIPDKSVTSIIGPSGCGKTTLLKSLNRLLDDIPEVNISGSVLVDGEDIYGPKTEVTHIRKKMGLLAQRPFPLPMSIYDNIAYGPRIHGLKNKKELNVLVEHYLQAVGLWEEVKHRLHTSASALSIGQQQRLCLARGLAVEPEIILGDESTSALDPISTKTIEDLLIKLKENYTIVLVTHILRQARRVSDFIVFVYMGEIIEFGPTEEVLLNPKEALTKDYVKGFIS